MWTSIREVHKSLIRRDISVTKLCNDSFKIIEDTKHLNAFITICEDQARNQAKHLDEIISLSPSSSSLAAEHENNLLFGIPISVKDNFCTNQILTTCGSKMLHNFVPPYTATVVSKLMDANSIIVGKTNMDEFAMGSSCTTSYYGHAANYWKMELLANEEPSKANSNDWYMAGGSSTGSAVSVASGACFASIGTDTGGSTRQPASLTGVVGFKPTYGLISRFGLIPLAHCLDVVSLFARNVDDVQIVFDRVVGQDENDLTTVDHNQMLKPISKSTSSTDSNNNITLRIGIPEKFVNDGNIAMDVAKRYSDLIARLSKTSKIGNMNVEVVNVDLPHARLATECYTIISSAEIASNMSCYDGVKYGLSVPINEADSFDRDTFFKANRDAGFGPEVKKRILLGNYLMLAGNREKYLTQAFKVRRLISDDFTKVFVQDKVDVLLMPSTPTTSVTYAEWLSKQDENKLFLEDYFLIPANLANLPSISLPGGELSPNELPIGIQLVANKFHDLDLLSIARLFEQHILIGNNNSDSVQSN